jgi:hypothetical protein
LGNFSSILHTTLPAEENPFFQVTIYKVAGKAILLTASAFIRQTSKYKVSLNSTHTDSLLAALQNNGQYGYTKNTSSRAI